MYRRRGRSASCSSACQKKRRTVAPLVVYCTEEPMSVDLSTVYLGIPLAGPFIAGASPLGDHMDTVRRLEDAGCAAIVLHSLFEEQITQAQSGRIRHMDPLDERFAGILSYFPEPSQYALGPDEYLEHILRVR